MTCMERLDRAVLLRLSASLKAEVEAYAEQRQIPESVAFRDLIRIGLKSEWRRARKSQQ
jgi:hypothetical protein